MFGALPYLACLRVSNVATVIEVGWVESVLLMVLVNLTGVDRPRTLAFSHILTFCTLLRRHPKPQGLGNVGSPRVYLSLFLDPRVGKPCSWLEETFVRDA